MVFDVAVFRHLADDEIIARLPAWLFGQHERIARFRWGQQMQAVQAAEAGTLRALAHAFSKSHVPDLQTYDEAMRENGSEADRLPSWMDKFEQANRKPSEAGQRTEGELT